MKAVTYAKYAGENWDSLSLEELLNKLSDYLLQSGFNSRILDEFRDFDRDLQSLHNAILQALLQHSLIPEEMRQKAEAQAEGGKPGDSEVARLVEYLIQRLSDEGYIKVRRSNKPVTGKGARAQESVRARFELTDKALDFLGYKALRNLLGSLGRSSFGRHDTRDLDTGIESTGVSRRYEFGDTMNLDASATILNSIRRRGLALPLDLDYPDLEVHQCEYQSSCATVLMLDCSHSMILYGEDRFTPAKKVSLALAHLIRTQYPGDSLHVVLFHDSAEEIPLARLARV